MGGPPIGPAAERGWTATIIDAHVHVCVLDEERYPFTPLLGYTPQTSAPVESLVETMARFGVDSAVLVQPSYYGYDHRYLQYARAAAPQLRAVGLADPFRSPPAWPAGCEGVRLNAVGAPGLEWLRRTVSSGFWHAAAQHGLVLCVQCFPDQVAGVAAAAAAEPGLRCVVDHFGRGAFRELTAAAGVKNLFVKVSGLQHSSSQAHPHRDAWAAAMSVLRAFGPERCLWGTDASPADPEVYGAQIALWRDLLPITAGEREQVMGGTAHELFFAGPAAAG